MVDGETEAAWPVRAPMRVEADGAGAPGGSVSRLLDRMRRSAFQGRKLGEAFEAWTWMIDHGCLIAMGLAGSMASAGLGPLVAWLVERGYVDVLVSTSANATEDILEARGVPFYQVDPDHLDDKTLWQQGYYRFYDHVVSARAYDLMEDFTRGFFDDLERAWSTPTIPGVQFFHELGRWLDGHGLDGTLAATCFRHRVPLFVPAAPDGPLAEGYRTAKARSPVVDFFRDYDIALDIMSRYMAPGPGTAAIFIGGGVPKDFIQITATSVAAERGGQASPHVAAIQITTDNTVFGGLGGAGVHTECISWGKETADGRNVMVFADMTIALPLLCQGLAEHYGSRHVRPARAGIAADLGPVLAGGARNAVSRRRSRGAPERQSSPRGGA